MKLITFNSQNTANTRKGDATIRFSKKGANAISALTRQNLGLNEGDCIAIHQDEENPADWYLSKDPNGFKLRKQSSETMALYFNCTAIANTVLDALGIEDTSHSFKMGEIKTFKKVDYYTIITACK